MESIKKNAISELSTRTLNGKGLRIGIVHTKWNKEIIQSIVSGCTNELKIHDVSDIITVVVPGSFELPFGAKQLMETGRVDAVICIGCLIKGDTKHFEYISKAVSNGIMKLNLSNMNIPVIFGVLTCLTEEQAKYRAGLLPKSHNHGVEWAQSAIEMARLKESFKY